MTKKKLPYPVRIISHGMRLPSYVAFFESKIASLSTENSELQQRLIQAEDDLASLRGKIASFERIDDKITDLQHRLAVNTQPKNSAQPAVNHTVSDNHTYDQFYKRFEDKFRGSENTIKERVAEHLPLFNSLSPKLKKFPILDIGCGRGEMLGVLKENGYLGIGVDMNESMVNRAIANGFEAYCTDASTYLRQQNPDSLAAVTGFHIVEHIPFESLMEIFQDCYRSVARGGFVLFETPNPETLSVGAHTFYLDPSHQRPIPPQLLAFMLEYSGFESQIIRLHDMSTVPSAAKSSLLRRMFTSLYGPADYAVVAYKR